MKTMTSRDRMLRAIAHEPVDRAPCCFMSFTALRRRHNEDLTALCRAEREMGLDSMLFIPKAPRPERPEHPELRGLPVRIDPEVTITERRERGTGGQDLLHKTYHTPSGPLTTRVRLSADWPHGDHIPLMDDFQVPRAIENLVKGEPDLDPLRHFLLPPSAADAAAYRQEAARARAFSEAHGVVLAGGWGVGVDMANWLCGMANLTLHMIERPDFVAKLLRMIHDWNRKRMELVLSAPVDIYFRRAWYEGCDFIPRAFYEQHVLPLIKAEADLAHAHGARFCYICSSGTMPLLGLYPSAGIDVLVGVDPVQGTYTDMAAMKRELAGSVCLWGGVSGAITVERGTEEEVRGAVREALRTLGPTGCVLSPVDNITVDAPRTWRNVRAFIDEWRQTAAA
ncbi:MAG: hypothetical protein JXR37_17595 [Kiritimatiellae bacterium]|nr:hypothetical protein [Kiritimatiellia bacterium]